MRFSINAEWGWCGFGKSKDLTRELRLGWIRVGCCWGSLYEQVQKLHADSLRAQRNADEYASIVVAQSPIAASKPIAQLRAEGVL